MSASIDVIKDLSGQRPVPTLWRETLASIVECLTKGDFELATGIPGVLKLAAGIASRIEQGITSYGATLVSLPEAAWETSVCQWMRSYWEVLVDLYTEEEGSSDLVLTVRVRESGSSYSFEVISVLVP